MAVTATVSSPVPSLGSLGLQSPDTLTVRDWAGPTGTWGVLGRPGDLRPGDFSLGSRDLWSAELGWPDLVGDTIFNLESSGLACLSVLTVWPDVSVRGSLGEI